MKILREIGIMLGLSVVVALSVNHFSPVGIALVGSWDTEKGVVSAKTHGEETPEGMEITSVAEARAIYDRGETLFVDARGITPYEEGHIRGAISFPINLFEERIEAFLMDYPPERPIVSYCSGRECEDSHKLARLLLDMGYGNVRVFIDGYPGWEKGGHPVD